MLDPAAPAPPDYVRGDTTNLMLPAHPEALRAAGAAFLTEAFQSFGSLTPDNRVARIRRFESVRGGNSGQKVALAVEYARAQPSLHRELFVKFSRDLTDPFRDRRRHELEAEIRVARLSRLPQFPISVPVAYFADFHHETGTGLLITQRIAYGTGHIEPLRPKCMDHELTDPLAYYRATFTALARLAAAHKAGRLSPLVDELFGFDPAAAAADLPIPFTEQELRERIARYTEFAERCPRLLPASLTTPQFIARFERLALRALRHEVAIKRFLHSDRDFIALCHWNTNIDNAWFWRDEAGELQCGLLDWGMARQMNVGYALWGGLCGASLSVWDRHLDELLALFIAELHGHGGPRLDIRGLRLHLELSVLMLGLALLMDAPALVLTRLPEATQAQSPFDPLMRRNEVARSFLHLFTAFLNVLDKHELDISLDAVLHQ